MIVRLLLLLKGEIHGVLRFAPGRPIRSEQVVGCGRSEPFTYASEAMQKQFGLKLEMEKRLLQILVIDHIDEKPTDN